MIFYFDTETSGLNPDRNGILQIAWIIEKNGEVVSERAFDVKPEDSTEFNLSALAVNNFTLERMKAGKDISYVLSALKYELMEHRQGSIRFIPAGQNVGFDISFLKPAAARYKERLDNHIDFTKPLDTRYMMTLLDHFGKLSLPNYKLETACNHFGIPIQAHDALSDIRATRALFLKLKNLFNYGDQYV